MTYPFVQGIDYGPRKGTLGFNLHMSEGGDELVTYLSRRGSETAAQWHARVRGVSCNFAILSTGAVTQMVGWGHAAGNLNPDDRSTNKAFYGRRYLLEVLGDKWYDPNAYTLSVELAGKRANGPTRPQVESLVTLVAEGRRRYPQMRGAFGHADQTDTKGCPGTAPLMLEAWTRIGHGLFAATTPKEEPMQGFNVPEVPMRATLKENPDRPGNSAWMYTTSALVADGQEVSLKPIRPLPLVGYVSAAVHILAYEPSVGDTNTVSRAMYVRATDIAKTEKVPEPEPIPVDCTQAIEDAIATDRLKAHVAWRE